MTLAWVMIFLNRNSNLQKTKGKIYQTKKCWQSKETVMRREGKIMGWENYLYTTRPRKHPN